MRPDRDLKGEESYATTLDAQDTLSYGTGLVLSACALCLAYPNWVAIIASLTAVLGLWLSFVRRYGVSGQGFNDVALTLFTYPRLLARRLRLVRTRLVLGALCFSIVLCIEALITPLFRGTIWLEPMPYALLLGLHFTFITLYRAVIFFHHLRDIEHVETFLQATDNGASKPAMASIWIGHGLLTGLVTHACLLIVPTLWWRLLSPSLLFEALLLFVWLALTENSWTVPTRQRELLRLADEDHITWHTNQTLFALFHAHHHDAIPSGLIASHGVGLLEAVHRTLLAGDWLGPCSYFCWNQTKVIKDDIQQHQFIPGVFPGTRRVVERRNHHVVHHLGGVLPLGTGLSESMDAIDADYVPENPISLWFLDSVEEHEGLSTELRHKYLSVRSLEDRPAEGCERS